jgi:hypothetical protein
MTTKWPILLDYFISEWSLRNLAGGGWSGVGVKVILVVGLSCWIMLRILLKVICILPGIGRLLMVHLEIQATKYDNIGAAKFTHWKTYITADMMVWRWAGEVLSETHIKLPMFTKIYFVIEKRCMKELHEASYPFPFISHYISFTGLCEPNYPFHLPSIYFSFTRSCEPTRSIYHLFTR